MATEDAIRIEGLRDLQKALRDLDGESQKMLRVVLNQAAETVIGGARRRVPNDTGVARASLKPRSGQREATVVGGGRKAPYYPWLDFGGNLPRGGSRPFVKDGRYLYPSWSANRDSILVALAESLAEMVEDAGLEIS